LLGRYASGSRSVNCGREETMSKFCWRILFAAWIALAASGAHCQEALDFKGKTVTVLVAFEPNETYDLYGRLFARFLGAHLPGQPTVIVQYMPGAGGLLGANYLYNQAPRDGTVLGVISQTAGIGQILGTSGIRYDVRKFAWIGRMSGNAQLLHAWHTSAAKTIADATVHQVIVGGTGPTSSSVVFPHILNDLVGTKFKVIPGYAGPNAATLAMQNGEVDAVVRPWTTLKAASADWLRDKKIYPLVVFGLSRPPDLPDVPAVVDLGRDEPQRQLLALFASGNDVGNAIVAPPGLSAAVAAGLRKAFDEVAADPAYLAAAREARLDPDPLSGEKLQQINESTFDVPPTVVEQAKRYNMGN
jgi:tripartite-type tricarboxylate transporter receptor subunit TctC